MVAAWGGGGAGACRWLRTSRGVGLQGLQLAAKHVLTLRHRQCVRCSPSHRGVAGACQGASRAVKLARRAQLRVLGPLCRPGCWGGRSRCLPAQSGGAAGHPHRAAPEAAGPAFAASYFGSRQHCVRLQALLRWHWCGGHVGMPSWAGVQGVQSCRLTRHACAPLAAAVWVSAAASECAAANVLWGPDSKASGGGGDAEWTAMKRHPSEERRWRRRRLLCRQRAWQGGAELSAAGDQFAYLQTHQASCELCAPAESACGCPQLPGRKPNRASGRFQQP